VEVASRLHVEAPRPWIHLRQASDDQKLEFSILLKQKNLDQLDKVFREVSDPTSSSWGKFLTREELNTLIRPDEAIFQLFFDWMRPYQDQIRVTVRADAIKVLTTVKVAGELLQVPFHVYKHSRTGRQLTRLVGSATIPAELAVHIDLIAGISEFFTEKQDSVSYSLGEMKKPENLKQRNDILVTPSILKNYYNVPLSLVGTNPKTVQGIAAFNDYFSLGALKSFEADQQLPSINVTRIGPDCSPSCDEFESDLDVQYITAMGQNIKTYFINQAAEYWILQFVEEVLSELNPPPLVFSISYGWAELQQCDIAVVNC